MSTHVITAASGTLSSAAPIPAGDYTLVITEAHAVKFRSNGAGGLVLLDGDLPDGQHTLVVDPGDEPAEVDDPNAPAPTEAPAAVTPDPAPAADPFAPPAPTPADPAASSTTTTSTSPSTSSSTPTA